MNKLFTLFFIMMMTTTSCLSAQPQKVKISAGGHNFTATLEQNATTMAFVALLPITMEMNEHNGNEKYCYMSDNLPTNASNPGTIQAGDIMLYGSSCVVIFYKTFQTSFSYTRIGRIDDVTHLQSALGNGSVSVSVSLGETLGIGHPPVKADGENKSAHTLSGLVANDTTKGIVVQNGKKILR